MKRFVALRFHTGWAVWDNDRSRFSDGIYHDRESAQAIATRMNEDMARGIAWGDRDWFGEDGGPGLPKHDRVRFDEEDGE